MKNGTRNFPERILALSMCRVLPSNGRAPHTNTYNTTPKLWKKKELIKKHFNLDLHIIQKEKCDIIHGIGYKVDELSVNLPFM